MIDVKNETRTWLLEQIVGKPRQATEKTNVSPCKAPIPKARSQLPAKP